MNTYVDKINKLIRLRNHKQTLNKLKEITLPRANLIS